MYGYGKGEEIVDENYDITGNNNDKDSKYGRRINFADINGDKKYVENNDTRLKYGIGLERKHLEGVFIAEDCEDKEELLRLTKEELERRSQPKISYDINVEDISKYQNMGGIVEGVGLGDEVLISDKSINEKVLTRVIKIVDHPFTGEDMDITLGNYFINLADNLVEIERLKQLVERREKLLGDEIKRLATMTNKGFLRSVTDLLNKELNDTDGFVYFIPDKGIRIYDKPIDANPTKCIELGGGHLRIANKKLANGEFDFTTFGTGDGFTASLIVAGILKGGKVEFDLENGTFLIGEDKENFSMLWDGKTLKLRNVDIDLSNNYQISEINDKISNSVNNFNNSIVNLDGKLSGLSSSIDDKFTEASEDTDNKIKELGSNVETKLSNITGEIESVKQDFKVGQGQFESTINTKIKNLSADVEVNFEDVNKRISGNVTGIANLNSQIKQTESSITQSISNQIKAVNDKISTESSGIKSYVQNNYSTKTQTADKIASEISSVKTIITNGDKDVKSYIERNYSTTTQTNSMIESKVSSINSRLGSAESRISQTNSKIESEIREVMNKAASDYFNLSTKITQTKDAIESKVSSSEARSIFRQEANSFTFDARQVNFNSDVTISGNFRSQGNENYTDIYTELYNGALEFESRNRTNVVGRIFANKEGLWINSPNRIFIKCGESYLDMKPQSINIGTAGGRVNINNLDVGFNLWVNGELIRGL